MKVDLIKKTMDIKIKNTAEIHISKEQLTQVIIDNLDQLTDSTLEGYEVVYVNSKTRTHTEPGADIHDTFYVEVFDGLVIKLEKHG